MAGLRPSYAEFPKQIMGLLSDPSPQQGGPSKQVPHGTQGLSCPGPDIETVPVADDFPVTEFKGCPDMIDHGSAGGTEYIGGCPGSAAFLVGSVNITDFDADTLVFKEHAPHVFGVLPAELSKSGILEPDLIGIATDHPRCVTGCKGRIKILN